MPTSTYRGIPIVRRGRDWIETILIQATGRGWDSIGLSAAEKLQLEAEERAAAEDWKRRSAERRRVELQRAASEAGAARRRALGLPSKREEHRQRLADQTRCAGTCDSTLDGYVSAWRWEDGAGICRACDEALDRDHADLSTTSTTSRAPAAPAETPMSLKEPKIDRDPVLEQLRQRLRAEQKPSRPRRRRS